jgi:AcrR family transcriptional regulator
MPRLHPAGDRKTLISDTLLRIAAGEGIAALTMGRLARELGVSSAALFRHFPTRDAMLGAAGQRLAALLLGTLPPDDLAPLDRLRLFVLARLRMMSEHPGIPQLVFSDQFAKALPPTGARAVRGAIHRSLECLAEAAREAAARGDIRADIPPAEVVTVVVGTLLARGLMATHAPGAPADPQTVWRGVMTLLAPVPLRSASEVMEH